MPVGGGPATWQLQAALEPDRDGRLAALQPEASEGVARGAHPWCSGPRSAALCSLGSCGLCEFLQQQLLAAGPRALLFPTLRNFPSRGRVEAVVGFRTPAAASPPKEIRFWVWFRQERPAAARAPRPEG